MTVKVCQHCERKKVTRPRGLCWGCHAQPAVREKYPSTSKYARQGLGIGNRPSLPATGACPHPAGSAERIATMRRRVEAGQATSHPADNRLFDVEG